MAQEANKVLVGAAAFGDWHNDAPGVRRLIAAQDLPEIGKKELSFAEVVLCLSERDREFRRASRLNSLHRGLRNLGPSVLPKNGDLFVANSPENEVRV